MRGNSFQMIAGGVLLGLGILFLLGNLTGINFWDFVWPLALIGLGGLLLTRRSQREPGTEYHDRFIGEIKRKGAWQVQNENIFLGVGDIDLDLTAAAIPPGVTKLRISGFAGDVDVTVPANVAVRVKSSAVAGDIEVTNQKDDLLFGTTEFATPNYGKTERTILLETMHFAGDIKVRQSGGV